MGHALEPSFLYENLPAGIPLKVYIGSKDEVVFKGFSEGGFLRGIASEEYVGNMSSKSSQGSIPSVI